MCVSGNIYVCETNCGTLRALQRLSIQAAFHSRAANSLD